MKNGRSRRGFTKQFKVDAVKLVTEQGYKLAEAARNLGIDPSVLRRWRDHLDKDAEAAFPGKGYMTPEFENKATLWEGTGPAV